MNRLLIIAMFAGASMFASCDNGAYDVNPDVDNSSAFNPLDPNSGVTVMIGSAKMKVNGDLWYFRDVYYKVDSTGTRVLYGSAVNDPMFRRQFRVFFPEATFKGKGTFPIGGEHDSTGYTFRFYVFDTAAAVSKFKVYEASKTDGIGEILFTIKGMESNNMRASFTGWCAKVADEPKDPSDQVYFSDVELYAPKK
jgi:hypothetical protein